MVLLDVMNNLKSAQEVRLQIKDFKIDTILNDIAIDIDLACQMGFYRVVYAYYVKNISEDRQKILVFHLREKGYNVNEDNKELTWI